MPDPIGLGLHHIASLKPADSKEASCYVTMVLRGSLFVHNIFLDGNTFQGCCKDWAKIQLKQLIKAEKPL